MLLPNTFINMDDSSLYIYILNRSFSLSINILSSREKKQLITRHFSSLSLSLFCFSLLTGLYHNTLQEER